MGLFTRDSKAKKEPAEFNNASDLKDTSDVYVEKTAVQDHNVEAGDYSGAVAKTDPEEMKLVRKLDIRIMTILWAMYFL
jgi:hypothetical protein